jgi:DHA1 family multidrug resistance protein-like MFS transporter
VIKHWGETRVIQISLLVSAIGLLFISFAPTFATLLAAVAVFTLATATLTPAITSLISQRATMDQGITMGLSNSFMSLGRIIGPLWAGFAFDIHLEIPYLSGAGILLIGFLISLVSLSSVKDRNAIPG